MTAIKPFSIKTPKGKRSIGPGAPAFIVAEMSANHRQSYAKAEEIVRAAAAAGADAIKLQTYTPDTMTIDSRKPWFFVGGKDNPKAWQGKNFYDLYKTAYTPWEWHPKLQKLAERLGLVFFSSPFDATSVDFLDKLGVPLFKVASYESTDIPLLQKIAGTGKPVVMSVGFATLSEIRLSVQTLRDGGVKDLALLHCVTSYADNPKPEYSNLRTMLDMRDKFNAVVGFSDNNAGVEIPVLAAAMGAAVIEKHFVIAGDDDALDARFSLHKNDFKKMVDAIRANERIAGAVHYGPQTPQEEYNRRFRRSLFAVEDIKKGERFTDKNVRSIRPADGLETKYYADVLGSRATRDIERGTPLTKTMVKGLLPKRAPGNG